MQFRANFCCSWGNPLVYHRNKFTFQYSVLYLTITNYRDVMYNMKVTIWLISVS